MKTTKSYKPISSIENVRLISLLFNYFVRSWAISLERGRRRKKRRKERRGEERNRPKQYL